MKLHGIGKCFDMKLHGIGKCFAGYLTSKRRMWRVGEDAEGYWMVAESRSARFSENERAEPGTGRD